MISGMQLPQNIGLDQNDPHAMFALGFALGGKMPQAGSQMDIAARHQVSMPQMSAQPNMSAPDAQHAMFGQHVSAAQLKDLLKMESFREMVAPQPMTQMHHILGFLPQVQPTAHTGYSVSPEDLRMQARMQFSGAQSFRAPSEQIMQVQLPNFHPQLQATSGLPYAQLRNFQMASAQGQSVQAEDSGLEPHTGGSEKVELVTPRNRRKQEDRGPIALTRARLEELFNGSLQQASKTLGICPTAIKKACRRFGITKWPYKSPNPGPKPKRLRAMMAADGSGSDAKGTEDKDGRAQEKDDTTEVSESESGLGGEDSARNSPQNKQKLVLDKATGKLAAPRIALASGHDAAPTLLEPERGG